MSMVMFGGTRDAKKLKLTLISLDLLQNWPKLPSSCICGVSDQLLIVLRRFSDILAKKLHMMMTNQCHTKQ